MLMSLIDPGYRQRGARIELEANEARRLAEPALDLLDAVRVIALDAARSARSPASVTPPPPRAPARTSAYGRRRGLRARSIAGALEPGALDQRVPHPAGGRGLPCGRGPPRSRARRSGGRARRRAPRVRRARGPPLPSPSARRGRGASGRSRG